MAYVRSLWITPCLALRSRSSQLEQQYWTNQYEIASERSNIMATYCRSGKGRSIMITSTDSAAATAVSMEKILLGNSCRSPTYTHAPTTRLT